MHGTIQNTTTTQRKKIGLALQGGGARGAFTGGVLKNLLNSQNFNHTFDISAITGTSAGAAMAVLTAYGLQKSGPQEAISLIDSYWNSIKEINPALDYFNEITSHPISAYNPAIPTYPNLPEQADMIKVAENLHQTISSCNPLLGTLMHDNIALFKKATNLPGAALKEHLKSVLNAHITNWEVIQNGDIDLFINAVTYDPETKTPYHKIFNKEAITADTVIASSTLDFMGGHTIDENIYFDGGNWANPCTNDIINTGIDHVAIVALQKATERSSTPAHQREVRNSHNKPGHELVLEGIRGHAAYLENTTNLTISMIELDVQEHWDNTSKLNTGTKHIEELKSKSGSPTNEWIEKYCIPEPNTDTEEPMLVNM